MNLRLSNAARRVALVAGLCVLAPVAGAQNLVGNPGFEENPPPNFGNNIGWTVAPWNIGPGNQSNVVKVDGGSAFNYGNGGPALDADPATGAGVRQHYLDVASGANSFYQSFVVPACGGTNPGQNRTATFSGAFSTRDNLSGSGSVIIRSGTGIGAGTAILAQANVNLPAPPSSGAAPWTFVNGTASVVAGSVVTFEVDMDNNVNFDQAFLGFTVPPCNDGTLTLAKTWVNAAVNDASTLTANRGTQVIAQLASTANTANETDTGTSVAAYGGETIVIAETLAGGNVGLYRPGVLTCTGGATVSGNQVTMPAGGGAVTCTYTNTRQSADLSITKDDGVTSVTQGSTTTFAITVANAGPDTVVDAVLTDAVADMQGLSACTLGTPACTSDGTAATCPVVGAAAGQLSIANLQGAGVRIPLLPVNSRVIVRVACTVQ